MLNRGLGRAAAINFILEFQMRCNVELSGEADSSGRHSRKKMRKLRFNRCSEC